MAANGVMADVRPKAGGNTTLWIVVGVLLLFWFGVVIGIGVFAIHTLSPLILWGLGILIMVLILGAAGLESKSRLAGVLIDSRNKFSLSRLQITLWTIMVLSAYLAIVMPRIGAMIGDKPTLTQEQALSIQFPEELLLAMGISAASFAGADLIKSNKKNKTIQIEAKPNLEGLIQNLEKATQDFHEAHAKLQNWNQDKAKTREDVEEVRKDRAMKKNALRTAEEQIKTYKEENGVLHRNSDPSKAKWVDLLHGEEMSNYDSLDMAKVQMLFLTLVVIAAYAAAISGMLLNTETLRTAQSLSFPGFASSLNTLLVISHGTYLSVKTVDHS